MDPRSIRRTSVLTSRPLRRRVHSLAGALPLAWTCLLALAVLSGCEQEVPESPPGIDDYPAQQTSDYLTRHSRAGVPVWELRGDVAERYPDRPILYLSGVHMVFYRDGVRDGVLTAKTAEMDERTEATITRGDVVVVTEEGRRLESEVLLWDPSRSLIHTDAFVRFTDGDQVLTGYGLETDPDLTNVLIKSQVEGAFEDENAAPGGGRR
jgi:LPS export ABC transporter protein LptC